MRQVQVGGNGLLGKGSGLLGGSGLWHCNQVCVAAATATILVEVLAVGSVLGDVEEVLCNGSPTNGDIP